MGVRQSNIQDHVREGFWQNLELAYSEEYPIQRSGPRLGAGIGLASHLCSEVYLKVSCELLSYPSVLCQCGICAVLMTEVFWGTNRESMEGHGAARCRVVVTILPSWIQAFNLARQGSFPPDLSDGFSEGFAALG